MSAKTRNPGGDGPHRRVTAEAPLHALLTGLVRAMAVAEDPALGAQAAGLARALARATKTRRRPDPEADRVLARLQAAGEAAALRAVLAGEETAIVRALALASTQVAASGIAVTEGEAVRSRGRLPAEEAAALRAAHEARHAGGRGSVEAIEIEELVRLWDARLLSCPGRWVDLGSGDGVSLARMAERAAAEAIVGTDVAWSYSVLAANHRGAGIAALPGRTSYMVFGPGGGLAGLACTRVAIGEAEFRQADALAEVMRRALGPRSFATATLLFPMHMPVPTRAGVSRPCAEILLETAVALLGPGGTGFVVTENAEAWQELARVLAGHRRVRSIDHGPPLSAGQLRALGIEPYTPSAAELDAELAARFTRREASHDECCAPASPFAWGLWLLFTVE